MGRLLTRIRLSPMWHGRTGRGLAGVSNDPEYGVWDGTTDDDEPEYDEDQPRYDNPSSLADDLEWEWWTDAGWDEGGEG